MRNHGNTLLEVLITLLLLNIAIHTIIASHVHNSLAIKTLFYDSWTIHQLQNYRVLRLLAKQSLDIQPFIQQWQQQVKHTLPEPRYQLSGQLISLCYRTQNSQRCWAT